MPCVGPICSARSSLVLMGLPTTRSSMFMKDRAGGFVTQGKGDLRNECAQRCLSRDTIALLGFAIKKPTSEFVVSRQSARWSETRGSGFHYFTPRTSPHLLSSISPVTSHPRRSLTPYRRDLNGWLT